MREAVHFIDSTIFRLSPLSAGWARFSANACGVKLQVTYDPDALCRVDRGPKVNEITTAKQMPMYRSIGN